MFQHKIFYVSNSKCVSPHSKIVLTEQWETINCIKQ